MTKQSWAPRGLHWFAAPILFFAPAGVLAADAQLNTGLSSVTLLHHPGSPGGSPTSPGLSIQNTSSPSIPYSSTLNFKAGGTTKGKAGVGRQQSSTIAKLVFPSGIGVDQTDPPSAIQSASAVRIDFNAVFDIVNSGNFGPTINTIFSVPFGAKIGPGGFSQFSCHIEWDKKIAGNTSAARAPYNIFDNVAYTNGSDGSGGLFSNGGASTINVLQTFTANTLSLNPTSIPGNAGNQLIVHGFIQFGSNNDEAPVASMFPRDFQDTDPDPMNPDVDPFAFFDAQQGTKEYNVLQMIPQVGFEVVPEPACISLLAGATLLLPRRRRA